MSLTDAPMILLALGSIFLAAQSLYATLLMLYAWEDEDKYKQSRIAANFAPPSHSFTILLPARHEEAVIQDTIQRVVELNYPPHLVQILVVIESGDTGTIAKVNEKLAELRTHSVGNVRLITFADPPINKPHGLNIGLANATGDIVTIFDAEDEPHHDILRVVNTVVVNEGAKVVQCGVQLMNYADRWFSGLNVLEYFFWFKSRMHYYSRVGMVPLGGNTVFMSRTLLNEVGGWDQTCLTEDADIGIRMSTRGVPIRVLYDDAYVTREETPPTVEQFIKQRTRWDQGFLQVLGKGEWLRLPTIAQRVLALYTLAFPILQALLMVYLPISLYLMFFVKVPILVAIISCLPIYALVVQYIVSLVGLYEFTDVHGLHPSRFIALRLLVAYFPFQCLLSFAALRAVWRLIRRNSSWEKTAHIGAHRTPAALRGATTMEIPAWQPQPTSAADAGVPVSRDR